MAGFLGSRAHHHYQSFEIDSEAQRNHHLRAAVAASLRLALAESKYADTYPELFRAWESMLLKATQEQAWLDRLFPGDKLEDALQAANEYRKEGRHGHDLAVLALRDLLREWLEPPPLTEKDDREQFLGIAAFWSDEVAETVPAEALPAFQRHFTAIVTQSADGHLNKAFRTKTLLRMDAREQAMYDMLLELLRRVPAQPREAEPARMSAEEGAELLETFRGKLPPIQLLPPRSNLPHRSLGVRFVGRAEDLWALHDLLIRQKTAVVQGVGVVYGTGGLGKTQLAVEYARRFAPLYPGFVLWADAEQGKASVVTQLSSAIELKIDGRLSEEQQLLQLWQALSGPPSLVILDNFPEDEPLEPYLPRVGSVQALVTTRRRDLDSYSPLRLQFLSEAAALELLNGGDGEVGRRFDLDEARPLLEALGGLPLALEVARALLNERLDLSPRDLAQELERQGEMQALEKFAGKYRNELPTGHEKSVAATFQVSWNLLDEPARELLRALADLAPVAVPLGLLRRILPQDAESPLDDALEESLSRLHRLSLIEREAESNDPIVHRLVQAFARTALPESPLFEMTVEAVEAEMGRATIPISDLAAYEDLEAVLPHAAVIARDAEADQASQSVILDRIGAHHQLHGRFRQASGALRAALASDQARFEPDHPSIAMRQGNLAMVLTDLGKTAEACALLRLAHGSFLRKLGPEHRYTVETVRRMRQACPDSPDR